MNYPDLKHVSRWKSLPVVQRDGIKGFIVQFILKLSESRIESEKNQLLLHKLNLVLVQVSLLTVQCLVVLVHQNNRVSDRQAGLAKALAFIHHGHC